ncbi:MULTISPECIES: DUF1439 domain-containing protein [Xanthomonas]|uniref:DUF1439 domain-containing protein n=1 Tax=Xanthomonas rydalmerensis TaxID=3046274 RepID=A0ABZ0JI27_9XANT|nr:MULTISPECIES: DUF1439 domain-containing protein [unclassified Xanthomonas]MXV08833.1 DUF1439 domain-containing protein [Xanthomonas sp. LMG 9002]WOS39462.1 DUF1439 domain-containing protein [Xanthomonas sp. DM-2023]WOS43646.1 DUF1439 domain-containing protein [Xanthomonas sp. DM-2023]WOS47827.1 DUF1439 domain-containing protein [Xanthomonas sp. DM-2023]WOS52005.1 DUF1439 domain-containing protein [Xanthomonas sp. DM-2023]
MTFRQLTLRTAALLLLATAAQVQAEPTIQGHQVSVGAADVQHYLDGSFPQTHKALGGLIKMTVRDPKLSLPPGDRLKMQFDLSMATGGGAATPLGQVLLTSALRYDQQSQSFHLQSPTIDDFRPAANGGKLDANTRELLNAWLEDYARKEPIYKLDPRLTAMLGDVQIQSAGVENGTLVVRFNQDIGKLVPAGMLPAQ